MIRDDADDADDAYGTMSAEDGSYVLRFERRLSHPVETVWHALTDPAALTHWFPQDLDGTFAPDAKVRFVFRDDEGYGSLSPFDGEVLEYDPPRLLAYSWGPDVLRWELRADGDGCLLIFTDTLDEQGKAARDGAGWHVCLDYLQAWMDGAGKPPADLWKQLHPGYVDRFGPAAATLGPPERGQ